MQPSTHSAPSNTPSDALPCCCALCHASLPAQVVLAHALLQWPYLSDLTLISAIISVFHTEWGLAPKLPPAWLQLKRTPWLYFNLVLTDSQVRVNAPVQSCACAEGFEHIFFYVAAQACDVVAAVRFRHSGTLPTSRVR